MRIDTFNKISELYKASGVKNTAKTGKSGFSDMLEISQTGKDYQVAKQIIARTPDVRENLINDIKKRMEAGTYNVSIEDVANKLVDKSEE
jgi:negative regulator of flagellin synthesis FlgM